MNVLNRIFLTMLWYLIVFPLALLGMGLAYIAQVVVWLMERVNGGLRSADRDWRPDRPFYRPPPPPTKGTPAPRRVRE